MDDPYRFFRWVTVNDLIPFCLLFIRRITRLGAEDFQGPTDYRGAAGKSRWGSEPQS